MSRKSRRINKWEGYFLNDCDCIYCENYRGKKHGCKYASCCYAEEKLTAIANGRIKRGKGATAWDT